MLSKNHFIEFIDDVNTAFYNFRIWVYTNNKWVEIRNLYHDNHFVRYMNLILHALQQKWLLDMARLLDEAYFCEDRNKPRLSVNYVIEESDNQELKDYYNFQMNMSDMRKFVASNRQLRNEKWSHKVPGSKAETQKAGTEKFFEIIEHIVKKLKEMNSLNVSSSLKYQAFDSMAKTGTDAFYKNFNISNN